MIHLYVALQYDENDLEVYLLKGAMRYLNASFGTKLTLNHTTSYDDASHIIDVLKHRGGFHQGHYVKQKISPKVEIITKILLEKNQVQFECQGSCAGFCYCKPQMIYRECFLNANIFAIYGYDVNKKQCLLCGNKVKNSALDAHINVRCAAVKIEKD